MCVAIVGMKFGCDVHPYTKLTLFINFSVQIEMKDEECSFHDKMSPYTILRVAVFPSTNP